MYDPTKHHRRSIRLNGYNYSQDGAYFVTLCIQNREPVLGNIQDQNMVLSKIGEIIQNSWLWLFDNYDYLVLDEWVIMPNHLHGIIIIRKHDNNGNRDIKKGNSFGCCRGGSRTAPTETQIITKPSNQSCKSLGRIIVAFKTVSTKHVNIFCNSAGEVLWQRNYYEHIIRNQQEIDRIREYIRLNPFNWQSDENNLINMNNKNKV